MTSGFDSRADSGYVDGGFDARIPAWDGMPTTWERFKVDVKWWMAGEDMTKVKFNVGVRFVKRQRGLVKSRLEQFEPSELAGIPSVMQEAATEEDEAVWSDGDPFAGINKVIMPTLMSMTGADDETEKAELRLVWHKTLYRKQGERMLDWVCRFREQRNLMDKKVGFFAAP